MLSLWIPRRVLATWTMRSRRSWTAKRQSRPCPLGLPGPSGFRSVVAPWPGRSYIDIGGRLEAPLRFCRAVTVEYHIVCGLSMPLRYIISVLRGEDSADSSKRVQLKRAGASLSAEQRTSAWRGRRPNRNMYF
jgi:hypothetical protein